MYIRLLVEVLCVWEDVCNVFCHCFCAGHSCEIGGSVFQSSTGLDELRHDTTVLQKGGPSEFAMQQWHTPNPDTDILIQHAKRRANKKVALEEV